MTNFYQTRIQLRQAREDRDKARAAVAAGRELLERITAEQAALDRIFDPNDLGHVGRRTALAQQRSAAHAAAGEARQDLTAALAAEAQLTAQFAAYSDPRQSIGQFQASVPILLMPVRLETRFKEVGSGPQTKHELWVRVYPDDCWVDTFDPVLTASEVADARAYWLAMWRAQGQEAGERGAWRGLVGGHGSGRAAWIVQQHQPVNLSEKPLGAPARDIVLTIPAEIAPPAEEQHLVTYWRSVWLANGAAKRSADARLALVHAVGPARADELIAAYRPTNLDERPAVLGTRPAVLVSFVVFPVVDTRSRSWSRPPRVTALPDRFVFIGHRTGEQPLVVPGNPVPDTLVVGPDPSADADLQPRLDEHGNLVTPDELRWLSDFDQAEAVGMGIRVPLSKQQADGGFDRVLVLGLRLSADAAQGQAELETLLRHHAHTGPGINLVPQGTPTNNTEEAGSGHGHDDDPDRSFDDRRQPLFTLTQDWRDKRDGQWLAEYLGVSPALFTHVRGAGGTDQRAGRAMNTALWPATLGYWMQTMMAPGFSDTEIDRTRRFFTEHVVAGGAIPAIRIRRQPYGILPATAWSHVDWFNPADTQPSKKDERLHLGRLYQLLRQVWDGWTGLVDQVPYVGRPGVADPHRSLLDILGLHSGSVEWAQRYAESFALLWARLYLAGLNVYGPWGAWMQGGWLITERVDAITLLTDLGYLAKTGGVGPQQLDRIFCGTHNVLYGGVVDGGPLDDVPLSESSGLRACTKSGHNYLRWLADAASTSLSELYSQNEFVDGQPPAALLYLLLRHAVQLGFHDAAVRVLKDAGSYDDADVLRARSDDPFLHIRADATQSESRYQPLWAPAPGNPSRTLGEYLVDQLNQSALPGLSEQISAIKRLEAEPTARLERVFADHIDCCSYRLDAWLLGLAHHQLSDLRNLAPASAPVSQGIQLGGYAWLEPLRPEHKEFTSPELDDDLIGDFVQDQQPPLSDATNEGYVHAPSLNHAVAAAVLRNGYLSAGAGKDRQAMAVNVTSARIRGALAMLEGIRAGQSLSDLLGYQFERGLHDRSDLSEVDKFVYPLRKAFPLRADRMASTRTEPDTPIEAIEARNVLDGLALVEQIRESGVAGYPFGTGGLPPISALEPDPSKAKAAAEAINAEAQRLLDAHDAVADLALAEGVYQAVLGNYDRVASTYDAYARGSFPPEPDLIRTPLRGTGLTSRVALHLNAEADPTEAGLTPRARAEPALNDWLATMLPPLNQIGTMVTFRDAATGATVDREVTLDQLGLQPTDLLALVPEDPVQTMTELDDRVLRVVSSWAPRPDIVPQIRYLETNKASVSVFELMPLVAHLRRLTSTSRPLRATDLVLAGAASPEQDQQSSVDKERLTAVRDDLVQLRAELAALAGVLAGPPSDLLSMVDGYLTALVDLLARAATFGLPQTGWGFVYEFRATAFAAALHRCGELVSRWDGRLAEFDSVIARYDALPAGASDEQQIRLLRQAERAVSTPPAEPPGTPDEFRELLVGTKRAAFSNQRDKFAALQDSTRAGLSALRGDILALLPLDDLDATQFVLGVDDEITRFAADARAVLDAVVAAADRRLTEAAAHFDAHAATAAPADRADALVAAGKALLGADFVVIPRFAPPAEAGAEFAKALEISRSGSLFAHLVNPADPATPPLDFPVDTWLHGLARVRPKLWEWEQGSLLAEGFGRPEPILEALQLPADPADSWAGLHFPAGQRMDTDRLLYTAHFAADFNKASPQCGLLLDEWAERIPTDTADTGITFHYDRPNSEAPQAMLLVTPSRVRDGWRWDDLVGALNETLDLAKLRAVEPAQVDTLAHAMFLPATVMATQARQLTISANLGLNNRIKL